MKTEADQTINPISMVDEDNHHYIDKRFYGLTKREHFAAMAMQGLLSDSSIKIGMDKICQRSVEYSDALINELNKQSK